MRNMQLAALGDRVKDPISGFKGIVMSQVSYLHGCVRCGVAAEELDDGKVMEERFFDQTQLEVVKAGVYMPVMFHRADLQPTGGPPDREQGNFHR